MKLVEPLGLVSGRAAAEAVDAGLAHLLMGGPHAFTLARLHGCGPVRLVTATAIPDDFADSLRRVTCRPPPWAGLPADRPLVMGIVNVTPDSFSDGGDRADPDHAIVAARRMADLGADLIDIGGESTRPGAAATDPAVERERVLPVVQALAAAGLVVSIDTRNAATMAACLDAGARIVNDISGFAFDPAAAELVRARSCPVVVMHSRGTPATMASLARYGDVALEVTEELAATLARLDLAPGLVAVDPGLGFAKGPGHNEALLARLPMLANLGCRILVGASRKGFIGRIAGATGPKERMPGSLAAALWARQGGASILRVHDVAATVQSVMVSEAIRVC